MIRRILGPLTPPRNVTSLLLRTTFMTHSFWTPNAYPKARRSDHADTYHSEKHGRVAVHDPYQWLESYSDETNKWIDAQVTLTSRFLEQDPNREKLEKLIRQNQDFAKFSSPSLQKDGQWYWSYNSGLVAQNVIYRTKTGTLPNPSQPLEEHDDTEVFFDPNLLSSDGTAALSTMSFSRSGEYFAYGISLSGSDFSTIYIRPTSNPLNNTSVQIPDSVSGNKEPQDDLTKVNGNVTEKAPNGSAAPGKASTGNAPEKVIDGNISEKTPNGTAGEAHHRDVPNGSAHQEASNANALKHDDGRLQDVIRFVKFSGITWTHDNKGFFYQRYPERDEHGDVTEDKAGTETTQDLDAKLYYHRIGTSQADDFLIAKDRENREYMFSSQVTEMDGKYLMLSTSRDTAPKNKLWIADLTQNEPGSDIKWHKVIDTFDASYEYIANDGTKFYFITNKDAPQYRVVAFDLADPEYKWTEVIPEDKNAYLEDIRAVASDKFLIMYKRDVKDELYIYSMTGERLERLAEDFVGTIVCNAHREDSWFFATLCGFTTPGTIHKYDFKAESKERRWSVYRTTTVKGLSLDEFFAEQVWYSSKDGTKVPMFIVRHKDTKFDGTAPAIQYGYGGFSIPIAPMFSSSILTIIKAYGFIYASPNIRGGSEFGEEWHLAGTRERKVNVFDDFIAATQFLVANKYAAPGKVAINGGSNGGLLVAACVNRAPEGTFGAAVAEVGVLDMLKFSQFTIGKAWTSDYGDPQNPHDFDFIFPISPLHNVPADRILPPTLLMTADHDDRVVPLHSFKYGATLQHVAPNNPHPLLLRIDRKAGHGAGKSTEKRIKDAAAKWGFVAQTMGLEWRGE